MLIPWRVFCLFNYQMIRIPSSMPQFLRFLPRLNPPGVEVYLRRAQTSNRFFDPENLSPPYLVSAFLGARDMWDPEQISQKNLAGMG